MNTQVSPASRDAGWFKSSRSADNAHCVEVRLSPEGTDVRDSKNAHGPVLSFTSTAWTTFLTNLAR